MTFLSKTIRQQDKKRELQKKQQQKFERENLAFKKHLKRQKDDIPF